MPPKLTFAVLGSKPKREVTTSDYEYMRFSNGRMVAVAKDPTSGRPLFHFVKQDLMSASEIAKLPLFKSGSKSSSRKGGSRRRGSRRGARR